VNLKLAPRVDPEQDSRVANVVRSTGFRLRGSEEWSVGIENALPFEELVGHRQRCFVGLGQPARPSKVSNTQRHKASGERIDLQKTSEVGPGTYST